MGKRLVRVIKKATKFISFFKSRSFNESTLNKTAEEIANNPRSNFLHHNRNSLTQELKQSRKSERIPFVTNWTHKLSGFQRILQYHYNEIYIMCFMFRLCKTCNM